MRRCGPAEVADLAAFDPQESTLLDHWLSTKLRAPKDTKLPNQRQTVGELVTKTMVAEAFLKRSKHASTAKRVWVAAAPCGHSPWQTSTHL